MPRCPACHRRLGVGVVCPTDKLAPPLEVAAPDPGSPPAVPGYAVGELIGAGGYAAVWGATDAHGKAVALKVGLLSSEPARARFGREAEAMRRVGTPYVPALFDHGALADG